MRRYVDTELDLIHLQPLQEMILIAPTNQLAVAPTETIDMKGIY